jgi:hypothetical protein
MAAQPFRETHVALHRFKLGQLVRLSHGMPDRTGAGMYEIVRLMPESADGELHYRVRGPDKIERAVRESQLLNDSPS